MVQIVDVLDEILALPSDEQKYCKALLDEDSDFTGKDGKAVEKGDGYMRFLLNRQTMDLMQDIVDELEMSRSIPVEPRSISISDPVVLHVIQTTDLEAEDALQKAIMWYQRQKRQVQVDAMFVAITMYNDLNIVPTPYKEGEMAFDHTGEDATQTGGRPMPAWIKPQAKVAMPMPDRKINTNLYEQRLKQLYDICNQAGVRFTAQFRGMFEAGMTKSLRMIEPEDSDGFQSQPPNKKVQKKSSTKSADQGEGSSGNDDN